MSSCLVLSCRLGLNHSLNLGVLQGEVRRMRDCVTGDLVSFWSGSQAYGSFILSFYCQEQLCKPLLPFNLQETHSKHLPPFLNTELNIGANSLAGLENLIADFV